MCVMSSTPAQPTQQPHPQVSFNLPPEEEAGHYADFANIWHNQETFILDFATLVRPPELGQDENGNPAVNINSRVVARVRIPASQVWEVMRALEQQLTAWEAERKARQQQQPPAGRGGLE